MNALTAALCKKPAIGFAMYLASMCGHNQALTTNNEIDLSKNGIVLTQEIYAPMDECYHMAVEFVFETSADMKAEGPSGSSGYRNHPACEDHIQYINLPETERAKLGAEIMLQVESRESKGSHVSAMEFISRCPIGFGDKSKTRSNQAKQGICLKKGHHVLTIKNLQPILVPKSNKVLVFLIGNGNKWTGK